MNAIREVMMSVFIFLNPQLLENQNFVVTRSVQGSQAAGGVLSESATSVSLPALSNAASLISGTASFVRPETFRKLASARCGRNQFGASTSRCSQGLSVPGPSLCAAVNIARLYQALGGLSEVAVARTAALVATSEHCSLAIAVAPPTQIAAKRREQ